CAFQIPCLTLSLLFFSLLLPPPPISTLFPYTTLFRSFRTYEPRAVARWTVTLLNTRADEATRLPLPTGAAVPAIAFTPDGRGNRDRKSTRLNSSHVSISYAVFCLKKKTNEKRRKITDR